MPTTTLQDYIDELHQICVSGDLIKANLLMGCFAGLSADDRQEVLLHLAACRDRFAVVLLARLLTAPAAAGSSSETVRRLLAERLQEHPEAIADLLDCPQADLALAAFDELAGLPQETALAALNRCLSCRHAAVRSRAKEKLAEAGSQALPHLLANLEQDNADLLIHSLNVLGQMSDPAALPAIRNLLRRGPASPNVRFAAYEALGLLPMASGSYRLAEGLEDESAHVRIAAAQAIEHNWDEVFLTGLKNMLTGEPENGAAIAEALLAARADRAVLSLLAFAPFRDPAVAWLADKAHPDLVGHYQALFQKAGHPELAAALAVTPGDRGSQETRPLAVVVDDSPMLLGIYKNALFGLGVDSLLFEQPATALGELGQRRPDVLVTDLNMPDIDGFELSRRVRQLYGKELPILMVTTQSEAFQHAEAQAAGVSGLLAKPFTPQQLGEALRALGIMVK